MRTARKIVFGLASASAMGTAILASYWLEYTAENNKKVITLPSPVEITTVVVAARPLGYGKALTPDLLSEVKWPKEAVPAGSFQRISDLFTAKGKRIVLSQIAINEPVLNTRITGPGQRASLSAMLKPDTKAVTIRVNDVSGVGGFVLPGDRVDILLTREGEKDEKSDLPAIYNHVLLQDVPVLAADQLADDRADKPQLARTITVEVDMFGARKLSLAASVGSLSLMLRQAGSGHQQETSQLSVRDLLLPEVINDPKKNAAGQIAKMEANQNNMEHRYEPTAGQSGFDQAGPEQAGPEQAKSELVQVKVTRAMSVSEYEVVSEGL